jgi:hypothetical protein
MTNRLDWLIIDGENHEVINERKVRYKLKNNWFIDVELNQYTMDRNVMIYDNNNKVFDCYVGVSKEGIADMIRVFETH